MKNKYRITGDLLTIQAKHKGRNEYIHLDAFNIDKVRKFRWYINRGGYAIASFPKELGDWNKKILMHRLLVSCPSDLMVDHFNHHKLDNRFRNLRICTTKQNQGNSRKQSNNKTGFKGVFRSYGGKFVAQVKIDLKSIHLGTFETAEEAARAYDKAALAEWGEFAHTNWKDKKEEE